MVRGGDVLFHVVVDEDGVARPHKLLGVGFLKNGRVAPRGGFLKIASASILTYMPA